MREEPFSSPTYKLDNTIIKELHTQNPVQEPNDQAVEDNTRLRPHGHYDLLSVIYICEC
jgi:hypothetical protein